MVALTHVHVTEQSELPNWDTPVGMMAGIF